MKPDTIEDILDNPCADWFIRNPPPERAALDGLIANSPFPLPKDYLRLLEFVDGGEGDLAIEPGWFQLWSVQDALENNRGYEVQHWHPGYYAFGSSGGGEMFAFKDHQGSKVFGIPFDSIDARDICIVADDFVTFAKALGYPQPDE